MCMTSQFRGKDPDQRATSCTEGEVCRDEWGDSRFRLGRFAYERNSCFVFLVGVSFLLFFFLFFGDSKNLVWTSVLQCVLHFLLRNLPRSKSLKSAFLPNFEADSDRLHHIVKSNAPRVVGWQSFNLSIYLSAFWTALNHNQTHLQAPLHDLEKQQLSPPEQTRCLSQQKHFT